MADDRPRGSNIWVILGVAISAFTVGGAVLDLAFDAGKWNQSTVSSEKAFVDFRQETTQKQNDILKVVEALKSDVSDMRFAICWDNPKCRKRSAQEQADDARRASLK